MVDFLTSDAPGLFQGVSEAPWGVYLGATQIVQADSVITFDYRQQWAISDYPVERGAFESYDKVDTPYSARLRFARGGSQADRTALLDSIRAIAGNLVLYSVVTPDAVYLSANIERFDYSQAARAGVGLIQVDVQLTEIRERGGGALSSTKDPADSAQVNGGPVQPTETPPAVNNFVPGSL